MRSAFSGPSRWWTASAENDEVERTFGQRFAQVLQAQVGARQSRRGEHVLAGVHAGELRLRMALEDGAGGDARPGPSSSTRCAVTPSVARATSACTRS